MKIDLVKKTLVKMIKELNLNDIEISDGHIESTENTETRSHPKMFFKKMIDTKNIQVVDFEQYDLYDIEEVPVIIGDISGIEIQFDNKDVGIIASSYDPINGVITIEDELLSEVVFELSTIVTFKETGRKSDCKNKLEIYPISTINVVHNKNITSKVRRYDLMLFTVGDSNGDIVDYYSDEIQKVLRRDFVLLDNSGDKTRSVVYIEDPCRFDLIEYNKDNRVVRGTILLKTIV